MVNVTPLQALLTDVRGTRAPRRTIENHRGLERFMIVLHNLQAIKHNRVKHFVHCVCRLVYYLKLRASFLVE